MTRTGKPEPIFYREDIRQAHFERQLIQWAKREGDAKYRFALKVCRGAQCRLDKRLADLTVMGVTA